MKFSVDLKTIEERLMRQPCMFKCTQYRLDYDKGIESMADQIAREVDKQIMRDILGGEVENDNPGPDVLIVGEGELPDE